jgi:hypothetical protein
MQPRTPSTRRYRAVVGSVIGWGTRMRVGMSTIRGQWTGIVICLKEMVVAGWKGGMEGS